MILNLLVGHTVKGIDKHYLAKLRISVLRAAAQRIADEIDDPRELADSDGAIEVTETPTHDFQLESVESYLLPLGDLAPRRHTHYLKRGDLHKLVWTAPVSEIESRMGISEVGLAKACRRAEIPLPGRGYWAKVGAGYSPSVDPLPPAPTGRPDFIRITGLPQNRPRANTGSDDCHATIDGERMVDDVACTGAAQR